MVFKHKVFSGALAGESRKVGLDQNRKSLECCAKKYALCPIKQ